MHMISCHCITIRHLLNLGECAPIGVGQKAECVVRDLA